jgi:hypothetical protein
MLSPGERAVVDQLQALLEEALDIVLDGVPDEAAVEADHEVVVGATALNTAATLAHFVHDLTPSETQALAHVAVVRLAQQIRLGSHRP